MVFVPKNWEDEPNTSTPTSAAAFEDQEVRVTDYAEALAYPVVPFKKFSNLAFNGVTDVASAINAALSSLRDSGGGLLGLPSTGLSSPGMCGAPIVLQNRTGIVGGGRAASVLKAANSLNANFVINYVSINGTTDPNAEFVYLADLCLDGNKANQSAGSRDAANGNTFNRDGVYFTSNPITTKASGDDYFDTFQMLERVWIRSCKGNGYTAHSRSDMRAHKVVVSDCEGDGYVPSYDTTMVSCTAGNNGLAGWYVKDRSAVHLIGCKAFYSGQITAASGYGFYVNNSNGLKMMGCESQDNWASGILLENTAGGALIQGFVADGNSRRGAGLNPGIDLWNSDNNIIEAICFDRFVNSTSWQQSALRIRNGSTGNTIRLKHYAVGGATVARAVTVDSDSHSANQITVNNSDGYKLETYGASFTPDVETGKDKRIVLTGNITINAPTAGTFFAGSRLRFIFKQDATGSRTVTFNSTFKKTGAAFTATTTANSTSVIEFQYDGTDWIEQHRALDVR